MALSFSATEAWCWRFQRSARPAAQKNQGPGAGRPLRRDRLLQCVFLTIGTHPSLTHLTSLKELTAIADMGIASSLVHPKPSNDINCFVPGHMGNVLDSATLSACSKKPATSRFLQASDLRPTFAEAAPVAPEPAGVTGTAAATRFTRPLLRSLLEFVAATARSSAGCTRFTMIVAWGTRGSRYARQESSCISELLSPTHLLAAWLGVTPFPRTWESCRPGTALHISYRHTRRSYSVVWLCS